MYAITAVQRSLAGIAWQFEALDNLVLSLILLPLLPSLRYCGRVVMASRLGSVQSVMGNLASSNLVSANFFIHLCFFHNFFHNLKCVIEPSF